MAELTGEFLAECLEAHLAKFREAELVYLISSHPQSAEEVDIHSNTEVSSLLEEYYALVEILVRELRAMSVSPESLSAEPSLARLFISAQVLQADGCLAHQIADLTGCNSRWLSV